MSLSFTHRSIAVAAMLGLCVSYAIAQEPGGRHTWSIEAEAGYVGASSPLTAWPAGGLGKLRYAENDTGFVPGRIVVSYRGRIAPTLHGHAVIDYIDDASDGLDITEAYVEWRPVPSSVNRHRLKAGAFYPPLSLENRDTGWSSPYGISFSAINTWLGEEVRPLGLEWTLRRPVGGAGSGHELGTFAAAFYGNDPAGTLLFWRGWSLHDRQSRLGDRLEIPPTPIYAQGGQVVGLRENFVEPFHEIDDEPGFYAGVEWQYVRGALVQLSHYDNRADPYAFASGQWGWHTAFTQVALQVELPGEIGLIAQWMRGETYWLTAVGANGTTSPATELVEDPFDSYFLLLTRSFGPHRVSLRFDDFAIVREEAAPALRADGGDAWAIAYRYAHPNGFDVAIEWLELDSQRDLWSAFYGLPARAKEEQLRLQLTYALDLPRGH